LDDCAATGRAAGRTVIIPENNTVMSRITAANEAILFIRIVIAVFRTPKNVSAATIKAEV
jgi:hypothetical protein